MLVEAGGMVMGRLSDKDSRILVVDDDKEVADMMVTFLTRVGYHASAAYGGKEGVARFLEGDYQLVLLDLKMPDMDGLEALEIFKATQPQVAVIMVTGAGTIESAVASIKAGAYDFITKPLDFKSLEMVVERALERHGLIKQRGIFRGLAIALLISVPLWLVLGILLARLVFN